MGIEELTNCRPIYLREISMPKLPFHNPHRNGNNKIKIACQVAVLYIKLLLTCEIRIKIFKNIIYLHVTYLIQSRVQSQGM
jgi:hypothetical protein